MALLSSRLTNGSRALTAAALACLFAAVGCNKTPTIETQPVEGIVKLDGQPVAGATVTFAPVQEGAGAAATGLTDETGKYTLTAIGVGPGAKPGAGTLPGDYYVAVLKDQVEGLGNGPDPETIELPEVPKGQRPPEPKVTHVVPQKYNDPQKSELKATVKTGKNEIPIELSSK